MPLFILLFGIDDMIVASVASSFVSGLMGGGGEQQQQRGGGNFPQMNASRRLRGVLQGMGTHAQQVGNVDATSEFDKWMRDPIMNSFFR